MSDKEGQVDPPLLLPRELESLMEGERYANKGVRSTMQWKDKLLGMTVTRGRPLGCIAGRDSHERKTFRVHHRE